MTPRGIDDRVAETGLAGPRDAQPGRALSDRLPVPWAFPLIVFAVTWLLILAAWYGSAVIYGQGHPWTYHFLFKDADYYLAIAEHGYPARLHFPWTGGPVASRTAFFPLFPLLIRLTSYLVGGHYVAAGLIVSLLAGAASAVGVWVLAARVRDHRVADRAVILYCFFPGAMTLGRLLYSEPLAVALAAAALIALVERRWLLAGIIGAIGTAERPTLLVLAVVAGVAALQAIWTDRAWRALLAPGPHPARHDCLLRLPRAPLPRLQVLVPGGKRPAGTSTSTGAFTRSASWSGLTRARRSTRSSTWC